MKITRISLFAAVLLLLGAMLIATAAPKITAGQKAPDFALKSTTGKTVKLSDYRGKNVVLVEFFSTTCPWCGKAAPGTRKLHYQWKAKGLQVLPVHVAIAPSAAVHQWATENQYTSLPVLLDTGSTRNAYGVTAVPTQVLVDKSGKVLQLYRGWLPQVEKAIAQDVAAAVGGKPLPKHSFPLVGYG